MSHCHHVVHDKGWQLNPKTHKHDSDLAMLAVFGLGEVSSALAMRRGYKEILHTHHLVYEHFVLATKHEKCNSKQPFALRAGALHSVDHSRQYPSRCLLREEKGLEGVEAMEPLENAPSHAPVSCSPQKAKTTREHA